MSINVITSTPDPETPSSQESQADLDAQVDEQQSASADTADETADESDTSETDEEQGSDENQESEDRGKKSPKGFQKRIDKLTKQRAEEARQRAEAEREKDYWKAEALKQKQTAEPEQKSRPLQEMPEGKPTPDNFETHAEYIEALTDWKLDQKDKAREAKERENTVKAEFQAKQDAFDKREAEFAKSHEDYKELIQDLINSKTTLSPTIHAVVADSDLGPALLYELAKNPDELRRLNGLGPLAAAMELGRMQADLKSSEQAPQKTKTSAPAPLNPVGSKSAGHRKTIHDPNISQAEFERLRREQMAKRA